MSAKKRDVAGAADSVRAAERNAVLLIELTSPNGFPRLTRAVLAKLHAQLEVLRSAPALQAAVLTGTRRCFAAGAHLAEVGALTPAEALRFSALGQSLMRAIERLDKPMIAAVRGHCLGGGLDLALACHVRMASTDAVFGHPGASLGIITGWGGTTRLPRLLGPRARARALELLITGRRISAGEALAWGLVSCVVPSDHLLEVALLRARALGEHAVASG